MKKMKLIQVIILFLFVVGCSEQNTRIENEQYVLEKKTEENEFVYRIEINFPQILNMPNSSLIEKSNILLKDAAFSVYGNTYDSAIKYIEKCKNEFGYEPSTLIEYDILSLSDDYISLIFHVDSFAVSSYTHHYLVTIDIGSGEYIFLNDLKDIEELINLINMNNFVVVEGTYSEFPEEDLYQPEITEKFVEILCNELKDNALDDVFDRFSSQNIGMDGENLYLYFPLAEAFHGYVILQVPWGK